MQDVQASVRTITIPTYVGAEYEKLPMFAENRVHQRSSGNPYPHPVINRVRRDDAVDKSYEAIVLENDFLYIVILPELGGRIFTAKDKTNGYAFFYQQHVIKPALIGMLGLWISGGVEFNWPVHHRPSTFLPVDYSIQRHADGSATVWLSEHEPLDRMKGMVGIHLDPRRASFETRMRVYNRTDLPKSFLWWENTAVPVNADYQIFFPPDVTYVNFHYKKATGGFPAMNSFFNTQDNRGGNDITYHRNTRNATSYFCGNSSFDFFGGYDHGKRAGVVHYADHGTSVGKKMFTWGYRHLSKAWEKALTDTDGAYAELMASSYSDNQPDFTWLEAGEVKEFAQSWYPIKGIGPVKNANADLALSCGADSVGLYPVCDLEVRLIVRKSGKEIFAQTLVLKAAQPTVIPIPGLSPDCEVAAENPDSSPIFAYIPKAYGAGVPSPRADNPLPDALRTAEDCWLCGQHIAQYRDPIAEPEAYWRRGLAIDPDHAPCLTSMGAQLIYRCRYEEAADYLRRAIMSLCRYNPNPRNTEAFYLLGLALKRLGRCDEAYEALNKALWNQASIFSSSLLIAQIDCIRGDFALAERHLRSYMEKAGFNQKGTCLLAAALRHQGRKTEAREAAMKVLAVDELDHFALNELRLTGGLEGGNAPAQRSDKALTAMDIACDYADAGLFGDAAEMLCLVEHGHPMVSYLRGYFSGDAALYKEASSLDETYCFPYQDWEKVALEDAVRFDDGDTKAHLYLGNLLYGRCRLHEQAAFHWEHAGNSVQALRNLAVARFHLNSQDQTVPTLLNAALERDAANLQLMYERNLVLDLQGLDAWTRFAIWESAGHAVSERDDLFLQGVHAANQAREWRRALEMLDSHTFIPCEGGEHAVAEEYLFANYALGLTAMKARDFRSAQGFFHANRELPENLGGGVWHEVMLTPYRYLEGLCCEKNGEAKDAKDCFEHVVFFPVNYFTNMYLPSFRFWRGMSLRKLQRKDEGDAEIKALLDDAEKGLAQKNPGWFDQTPFFNCFCEKPETARLKSYGLLAAYALIGSGQEQAAREMINRLLEVDPGYIQASVLQDALLS